MELNKKYYLISEAAEMLGISLVKLRYLEKTSTISVIKIKNRRYYTLADIQQLQSCIKNFDGIILKKYSSLVYETEIGNKIEYLINKFDQLYLDLKKII